MYDYPITIGYDERGNAIQILQHPCGQWVNLYAETYLTDDQAKRLLQRAAPSLPAINLAQDLSSIK